MKEPSIFTKIISGQIPSHKVYEDEKTLAFLDIDPITNGHTLVISKSQVDKIYELPDDEYEALMSSAKHVAKMLESSLGCVRVGMAVHGFDVPHAHVHLIPMNESGDFYRKGHTLEPDHEQLAQTAERIRQV